MAVMGMVLALLSAMPAGPAVADNGQEGTQLDISAATKEVTGEPVEIRVHLQDARGEPVVGVPIRLLAIITFLGEEQEVLQDEDRTDPSGEATLVFAPVEEGQVAVRARFDGAPGYAPATAGLKFDVVEPVDTYRFEPPGLQVWWARSRWILLPFVGIWIAYAVALSQVWRVRRYGPRVGKA